MHFLRCQCLKYIVPLIVERDRSSSLIRRSSVSLLPIYFSILLNNVVDGSITSGEHLDHMAIC
jgi:hypothetical protein